MNFSGTHEVRMLGPAGISAGYFDNYEAALAAVENEPSQYRAAYLSLNPIRPELVSSRLNPSSLVVSRNTASDQDILRRVRLLLDLDPPRPAGSNSTDGEKQAAREQTDALRTYLDSRGWPAPMLADSANGWHLLYHIELPNDDDSTTLVKAMLTRLKSLFPMLDAGNYNAARVCKLHGSWARKGEHTEGRPWRRSAIVEYGDDRSVTEAQLRELAPVQPEATRRILIERPDDVKLTGLIGFCNHYGVVMRSEPREIQGGWQIDVECPWVDEHSSESPRDTVVSFVAGLGNGFRCFHAHCAERRWRDFRAEVERRNPGLPSYYGKLPPMTHADVARDFVAKRDDFVTLYDQENETAVWLPGTRWSLGDPKDGLLRKAIRNHLNGLFERYDDPKRTALKAAPFVTGVLSEVRPLLPPKSIADFDNDLGLLPLPHGKIADLRTGTIREMRREDCQTRRLAVVPAEMPTPTWDRFLREVTCDDTELACYIERLMALAITGSSPHRLVFFHGGGRNGKGTLLRLMEKILRADTFTATIRPEELQRAGDDSRKRLFAKLRGKRLAFNAESVKGESLDWTLLKLLSGGDSLSGARLYENETAFVPTHSLIVLTNDRPLLPSVTSAVRGRLRFVPFNATFDGREDLTLETRLAEEAPGVLWRLICLCPPLLAGESDSPPCAVLDATNDLLDENDVSAGFIEECLEADSDGVTTLEDMRAAIIRWGRGDMDRVMAGVRARWPYGRKRIAGQTHQVRGLIGVRIRRKEG